MGRGQDSPEGRPQSPAGSKWVVFSRTLTHADWPESRIASGVLADEIDNLKREPLRLDLVEARTFPSGTVIHAYRPHDGTQ